MTCVPAVVDKEKSLQQVAAEEVCSAYSYLQGARLDLILMAVPVLLFLLRQALKELTGDDVLQSNQAGVGLI